MSQLQYLKVTCNMHYNGKKEPMVEVKKFYTQRENLTRKGSENDLAKLFLARKVEIVKIEAVTEKEYMRD